MLDRPVGSVILCDLVHFDRGKSNILGAGWTSCPPGPKPIQVFVVVETPANDSPAETTLSIDVSLWRLQEYVEDIGKALVSGGVEATVVSDNDEWNAIPVMGNLVLSAELEAKQDYVVVMSINGEPTSFARFETTSSPAEPPD